MTMTQAPLTREELDELEREVKALSSGWTYHPIRKDNLKKLLAAARIEHEGWRNEFISAVERELDKYRPGWWVYASERQQHLMLLDFVEACKRANIPPPQQDGKEESDDTTRQRSLLEPEGKEQVLADDVGAVSTDSAGKHGPGRSADMAIRADERVAPHEVATIINAIKNELEGVDWAGTGSLAEGRKDKARVFSMLDLLASKIPGDGYSPLEGPPEIHEPCSREQAGGPQIQQAQATAPVEPKVAPHPEQEGECCAWVIERGDSEPCAPTYWSGPDYWSQDHLDAVRFVRKQDAERVASKLGQGYHRVCEHIWMDACLCKPNWHPKCPMHGLADTGYRIGSPEHVEETICTCGAGHGSLEGHTEWCKFVKRPDAPQAASGGERPVTAYWKADGTQEIVEHSLPGEGGEDETCHHGRPLHQDCFVCDETSPTPSGEDGSEPTEESQ